LENVTMRTANSRNQRGLTGPLSALFAASALGLGALTLVAPVSARDTKPVATSSARKEVNEAAAALRRVASVRPIPQAYLDRALAIAVFDDIVKAAFIVGGQGGSGVYMRRTPTGWGAPAFVTLKSGSVGAQIGASRTDAVFLFMDQTAVDALAEGRFEFGTNIVAVAGPKTATTPEANTSTRQQVLVYAKQEGLFAGVSANGVKIGFDKDDNAEVYGDTPMADLINGKVSTPEGLGGLADALKVLKPNGSN
jgi:lipid-binding SYLF domain-containing protein